VNDALDLSILDVDKDTAVALARRGDDIAIDKITFGPEFQSLIAFRDQMDASLHGTGGLKHPNPREIEAFGRALFSFVIRNDLRRLYDRLPQSHVSLKILTDKPDLKRIPWEYWQEPDQLCPWMGRSVVRIIPTIGKESLPPLPRKDLTRVLFISADPIGLRGVSWQDVKATIERAYAGRIGALKLEAIEGDRQSLTAALQNGSFDLVHFSGHGEVRGGVGRLILVDSASQRMDYIEAPELARILAGRQLRLVVLSACETSAGNAPDDFAIIAEALIRMGIPAVVANQMPVPNQSIAVFVGALYKELLRVGNIDKAMTAGRIALSIDLRGGPEWGIPTLYRLHGAAQLYE